uniref:Uncharacterized protein n=1 Tax=Cacopsylla melanoneura TaxID=428564 RepID=A0A8D8V7A6_9HEMI
MSIIQNRGNKPTMSYTSIRPNHADSALFGGRRTPQNASSPSVSQPNTRSIFPNEDEDVRRTTYHSGSKVSIETLRHHNNYSMPGPSSAVTKPLDTHRLLSGTPRGRPNEIGPECRSYHSEETTESERSRRKKRVRHDSIGSDSDDGVPMGCGKPLNEPQPSPYSTHSRVTTASKPYAACKPPYAATKPPYAPSKPPYGGVQTNASMYRGDRPASSVYLSSPRLPSLNGATALSTHTRHRDSTSYRTHSVAPGHSCRLSGDYRALNQSSTPPGGAVRPADDRQLPLVDNLLRHGLPQISEDSYIYYSEPLDPPSCSSSCVNLCAVGSDIYDDLDSVSVVGMRALKEKTLRKYAEKRAREEEKERRRRELHARKRRKAQEYA